MAHTPFSAQSSGLVDHRGHQLVGVQRAFHQGFHFAFAPEGDCAFGRGVTVRNIDDFDVFEFTIRIRRRLDDLRSRTDEHRHNESGCAVPPWRSRATRRRRGARSRYEWDRIDEPPREAVDIGWSQQLGFSSRLSAL